MLKKLTALLLALALGLVSLAIAFADDWEMVADDGPARPPQKDPEPSMEQPLEPSDDDLWLKIGLKYGSSAAEASVLSCQDGFLLVSFDGDSYAAETDLTMYSALAVVPMDGQALLFGSDQEFIAVLTPDHCILSAEEDPDKRVIQIDGKEYRDGASYIASGSALTVINRITLEHYLRGVLANEMGAYYPKEALKAQAVTARSFAITNLNKHKYYGFDLCDNTNCQVYNGVSSETSQTDSACSETAGLILKSGGKPASGMYYAYSSGYTMNSEDVWTTSSPYLKGITDEYAGEYIWRTSVPFSTIKSKLESLGYKPGEILSVSVKTRLENTAVRDILVRTDTGDITVSKWSIVTALGGTSQIKSQFFYIGDSDYPEMEETAEGTIYTLGGRSYEASETVSVLGNDGIVHQITLGDAYATNGKKNLAVASGMSGAYHDETAENGTVYFTGFGFGHGVGMPQVSAKNMAQAGKTFAQILKYYYTDITIGTYR